MSIEPVVVDAVLRPTTIFIPSMSPSPEISVAELPAIPSL